MSRNLVTEIGGSDLRDRQPTCSNDKGSATEVFRIAGNREGLVLPNTGHGAVQIDPDSGIRTFLKKNVDDFLRRAVAKKLSELLLVIGNAIAANEPDEIIRREPR